MTWLLDQLAKEWAVIKQAPLSFAIISALAFLLAFVLNRLLFKERLSQKDELLEGHKEKQSLKDGKIQEHEQTINRLREERSTLETTQNETLNTVKSALGEEKYSLERQLSEADQKAKTEESSKEEWQIAAGQHEALAHELRDQLAELEWLARISTQDLQNVGAGTKITRCEVEIDLECQKPWILFTFTIFNGSVFAIAVDRTLKGWVKFANGRDKPRKLESDSKFLDRPAPSCERHKTAEFTLRQELSADDAAFIAAKTSRNGYFLFDELWIAVKGDGKSAHNIPVARLPTSPDDVMPRFKQASHVDESVWEDRRQERLSKIMALHTARGMYELAHRQLRREAMSKDAGDWQISRGLKDAWAIDILEALRRGYHGYAQAIYDTICGDSMLPESIHEQEEWVRNCLESLDTLITTETNNLDSFNLPNRPSK